MERGGVQEAAERAGVATRRAAESDWVDGVARYGLAAKGFSYGLVGVLAALLAIGWGGQAASREGALEVFAGESYGKVVLVAVAFGFIAYGLWRLVQAIFDRDDEGTGAKGIAKRVSYVGRAVIYGALAWGAFALLDGTGNDESQTGEARRTTAQVFDLPAGRWLVTLGGLIFIGVGVFNGYRAVTQKFEENWKSGDMTDVERRWGPRLSSVGLLSRFVVFSLIGIFLVKAAYQFESKEAIGLDGALRKIVDASYGPVLLGIVAAGLVCYALFCFFEARYRRV